MKLISVFFLFFFFSFLSITEAQNYSTDSCDKMIALGVKMMQAKDHSKSLELLTRTKNMAEENQWLKQLFLSINNIGLNYYLMSDYGEALNNYLAAYEIAMKSQDDNLETTVVNNIAVLYMQNHEFDKAYEYFTLAYSIAEKTGQEAKMGMYAINMALVSNQLRHFPEAKKYAEQAIKLLQNDPKKLVQAQVALAENLFLQGDNELSKSMLMDLLPELQTAESKEFKMYSLVILSKIYESNHDLAQAIRYATEAQHTDRNPEMKSDIFDQLARLYYETGSYQTALDFKDSVIQTKEQLYQLKNGQLFETNKIKFEMQNYRNQLSESSEKLVLERKIRYGIIFISVIFILFIVWVFRNDLIKNKQKKKIAELELEKERNNNLLREKQMKENETLALLQQEKLKNELEKKNRELTAKALQISSRIETIDEMVNALSKLPEVAKNEFLTRHIYNLKRQLRSNTYWDSFRKHFEEANQGFIDRLLKKHDDLTQNDIRFITFIYMNLSNQEISMLLNITPQSCRKRKERIVRKLGLSGYSRLSSYLSGI